MRRILGPALLAMVLVGACGDDGDTGDDGGDEAGLVGRTFLSDSITVDGEPLDLVGGSQVRLSFEAGQVSAHAGCNTLGGTFRFDGDRLVIGQVGGTEMGCDAALHEQDAWLAGILQASPTYRLEGARLRLEAGDTVLELVDRETADPDRAIEGTRWRLDGVVSGEAVSSAPSSATIEFADGQVTVSVDGCNRGAAPADVDEDERTIDVGPITSTLVGCVEPQATTEAAIFAVLEGTISFEIEAASLTLTHPSGSGLLLRAD